MNESHRSRPVLDNDQQIRFAVEKMSPFASDRIGLTRLLVEHFAVDLDLLAAAVAGIPASPAA